MKLGIAAAVIITFISTGLRGLIAAADPSSITMDRWIGIVTNIAILGGIVWPWIKGVATIGARLGKIEDRLGALEKTNNLQVEQNRQIIQKTGEIAAANGGSKIESEKVSPR